MKRNLKNKNILHESISESPILCIFIDNSGREEEMASATRFIPKPNKHNAKKRQAEDDSYESRQRKIITRSKSKSITSDAPEITGSSSTSVISPSDPTKITGPKSFSTFTKSLTLTKPSSKANIPASTSENDNSLTSSPHNSTPVSSPHNSITNTPASSPHNSIANTPASSSHNSKTNTPARAVHNPKNNTPERAVHNPKNNTPERSQSIDLADFDSDTYDNEEPDVTINLNSENQQSEIQQGAQDEVVIDLDDDVITLGEVADIVESVPAPIKINPLPTNVANFQKNKSNVDETRNQKNYLTECKCLFLRTRTPSKNVIQYIIQSIWPEYVVNSTGANTLIQKSLNNFNSWRNTFNTKLTALVSEMVEQLELTEMLTNSALVKFVDNSVIKRLLEFWMSQLHSSFDQHESSYKALKIFTRKAVIIHLEYYFNGNDKHRYITDVLDKVKKDDMNFITKNIRVPSLCETDIADSVEI
ncbi:unnamed protein product [Rhizophagus irregularis]|nr:unnamed protein product [Rhizophagus irregularis]